MKKYLMFLLTVASIPSLAQPVVSRRLLKGGSIDYTHITADYNPGRKVGEPVEIPFSLRVYVESLYKQILDVEKLKGLDISTGVFFAADGKIDYLLYEFPDLRFNGEARTIVNLDSLSSIISSKLPQLLSDYRFKWEPGKKTFHWCYHKLGTPIARSVKAGKDSTITSLEGAILAKDTLGVKNLMLSQSLLTSVPDVIYRFPNLDILDFTDNDIEQVKIDMSKLPKLRHLDLTKNLLTQDALNLSGNKSLQLLLLQKNKFADIPKTVKNCKNLKSLWLGQNKLTGLSNRSFRKMKRLNDLNFYKADLTTLPKGIRKLKRLEIIDLYYNNLTQLPDAVTRLKRLTHLAVAYNQISTLPDKINRLKSVHTFYAHHNRLSKLPPKIAELGEMKIMDLGYNWFTDFPKELTSFSKLQELDLSSNNFQEFPVKLLEMKGVERIFLRGNPFLERGGEKKYATQLSALKSVNKEVFD